MPSRPKRSSIRRTRPASKQGNLQHPQANHVYNALRDCFSIIAQNRDIDVTARQHHANAKLAMHSLLLSMAEELLPEIEHMYQNGDDFVERHYFLPDAGMVNNKYALAPTLKFIEERLGLEINIRELEAPDEWSLQQGSIQEISISHKRQQRMPAKLKNAIQEQKDGVQLSPVPPIFKPGKLESALGGHNVSNHLYAAYDSHPSYGPSHLLNKRLAKIGQTANVPTKQLTDFYAEEVLKGSLLSQLQLIQMYRAIAAQGSLPKPIETEMLVYLGRSERSTRLLRNINQAHLFGPGVHLEVRETELNNGEKAFFLQLYAKINGLEPSPSPISPGSGLAQ